jgi:pimeloyl-ACP methyl ester carboxylesterase
MVEDVVRAEHSISPNKPIYLLGNSFGGCLALAVAARHPRINLILVLVNPGMPENLMLCFVNLPIYEIVLITLFYLYFPPGKATSYERSDIKTLLSVFSPLSDRACIAITALLNYNIGTYLVGCSAENRKKNMKIAW